MLPYFVFGQIIISLLQEFSPSLKSLNDFILRGVLNSGQSKTKVSNSPPSPAGCILYFDLVFSLLQ